MIPFSPIDFRYQATLAKPVSFLNQRGLFSGLPVNMVIYPTIVNRGICFFRKDLKVFISGNIKYQVPQLNGTKLEQKGVVVHTVEHILSALSGLGICNAVVELDNLEIPGFDGSSQAMSQKIARSGIQQQQALRRSFRVKEVLEIKDDRGVVRHCLSPLDEKDEDSLILDIHYRLDIDNSVDFLSQEASFKMGKDNYLKDIASARTFSFQSDIEKLQKKGFANHLTIDDVPVIGTGKKGLLGRNMLRFSNELARHKILDIVGDISLCGYVVFGKLVSVGGGHILNHKLARLICDKAEQEIPLDNNNSLSIKKDINYQKTKTQEDSLFFDKVVFFVPNETICVNKTVLKGALTLGFIVDIIEKLIKKTLSSTTVRIVKFQIVLQKKSFLDIDGCLTIYFEKKPDIDNVLEVFVKQDKKVILVFELIIDTKDFV